MENLVLEPKKVVAMFAECRGISTGTVSSLTRSIRSSEIRDIIRRNTKAIPLPKTLKAPEGGRGSGTNPPTPGGNNSRRTGGSNGSGGSNGGRSNPPTTHTQLWRHKLDQLTFDKESAIAVMQEDIKARGIKLTLKAAGQKVGLAEVTIRLIREKPEPRRLESEPCMDSSLRTNSILTYAWINFPF